MSSCVTIPYLVCPSCYIPNNSWLQRKYTMTLEVPQCINYLLKANPKQ